MLMENNKDFKMKSRTIIKNPDGTERYATKKEELWFDIQFYLFVAGVIGLCVLSAVWA